ncbi:MAG: hypothetical protein II980_02415 [Clostridia bacterium]|nr:hypothetical protein [Clostridia bacterium]
MDALDDGIKEWVELKNILKASISKYIFNKTKKKPVVLPVIMNI